MEFITTFQDEGMVQRTNAVAKGDVAGTKVQV